MKRIILTLVIAFIGIISISANSFRDNNRGVGFGFSFGQAGINQHIEKEILMFDMTIQGVYFDIGGWPRRHEDDVRIDRWDDSAAFSVHAGYQLPITSWLKIIPMVGYTHTAVGITDGSRYSVGSYGIHNHFYTDDEVSGFDFGGQIKLSIPIGESYDFDIKATYTKFCWYAGLGFNIIF